jgi:hypothetical protein
MVRRDETSRAAAQDRPAHVRQVRPDHRQLPRDEQVALTILCEELLHGIEHLLGVLGLLGLDGLASRWSRLLVPSPVGR